jgi:hypothetical protein
VAGLDAKLVLQCAGSRIRIRDTIWCIPPYSPSELEGGRPLWVYRSRAVTGTVGGAGTDGPLNPTSAKLQATVPVPDRPDETWRKKWNRHLGFGATRPLPPPGIDGRYRVRVPAIDGVKLTASREGWTPEEHAVPAPGEDARLDFVLVEERR